MKSRNLLLVAGGVLLGVLLGLALMWGRGYFQAKAPPLISGALETGQPVPDIQLTRLDGQPGKLSDYKGRPVVINFWATWCQPCKVEMPLIEAYYKQHVSEMAVVGVDFSEGPAVVKPFVEQQGVTFPIFLDTDGTTASRYNVRGLPSTYFIDKDGVLRAVHIGPLDDKLLPQYIQMIGLKP